MSKGDRQDRRRPLLTHVLRARPRVTARRRGRPRGALVTFLAKPLAFALRTADVFVPRFI
ncbi:MAG: hypothetical protein JOZ49_18640 [Mycolicibacterium sp.]|nr:hypothetical protein [Mycolicibacterium sp.]